MTTFRGALATTLLGAICLAASLLWPEVGDPRARWTDEKSADYAQTNRDVHGLIHTLSGDVHQDENSPGHVHTPSESADSLLGALELERAQERSAALRAELEAAREIPPGWHLLLGLVGAVLLIVGGVLAIASRRQVEVH